MVGIVVASHSSRLAEGVVEVAKMMAPDVPIIAAGGMDDGSMGTSCRKIIGAVKKVYSDVELDKDDKYTEEEHNL